MGETSSSVKRTTARTTKFRFGIVLSGNQGPVDIEATSRAFVELCGRPLAAVWLKGYPELFDACCAGEIDLAWAPPVMSLLLEERGCARPLLAVGRSGVISYHGAIVVPRDSTRQRSADLRGCRVAWVSPMSAAGYLVPRLYLASKGYELGSFFAEERFSGGHLGSIDALLKGEVDAAAVYAHAEAKATTYRVPGPAERLRIVCVAGPIPSDIVIVSAQLDPVERARLSGALLALPSDAVAPLQKALSMTRFEPLPFGHLDPLRKLLPAARTG